MKQLYAIVESNTYCRAEYFCVNLPIKKLIGKYENNIIRKVTIIA